MPRYPSWEAPPRQRVAGATHVTVPSGHLSTFCRKAFQSVERRQQSVLAIERELRRCRLHASRQVVARSDDSRSGTRGTVRHRRGCQRWSAAGIFRRRRRDSRTRRGVTGHVGEGVPARHARHGHPHLGTHEPRRMHPRREQRASIEAPGGVQNVITMDTCHALMVSEPGQLAELLVARSRAYEQA